MIFRVRMCYIQILSRDVYMKLDCILDGFAVMAVLCLYDEIVDFMCALVLNWNYELHVLDG